MATIETLATPSDLSMISFQDACGKLGRLPKLCHLVCPTSHAGGAQKIVESFNCSLTMIPDVMLKGQFTWGVQCEADWVWSNGV